MPKGTYQAEATSNSEKIKPIALPIIEFRLSEGISQSVKNSIKFFFLNSVGYHSVATCTNCIIYEARIDIN